MLRDYIDNLESTIQWAHYQDDLDILCLARERMDQLLAYVQTLPEAQQVEAHLHIDAVLPMEWPLWMEACRFDDQVIAFSQPVTLH